MAHIINEELLLRRAALRKECFLLEKEYIHVFGEMPLRLIPVFRGTKRVVPLFHTAEDMRDSGR